MIGRAVNSAIILSEAFSSPAGIAGASTTLLAQVYSLPILAKGVAYGRPQGRSILTGYLLLEAGLP